MISKGPGVVMPAKEPNQVYELLPKFDCGLCGNPRCMTFARKLILKAQKPLECQFLEIENLKKIEDIIAEPEMERKRSHPNKDEDVIEISPCTEDGFVTLETQLRSKIMVRDLFSDFFDQYQLCISLSEVDDFDSMNCSSKMGYALVENKGKRTHVFKTGRIIMRRADDRNDALHTLGHISRMLMPARLCSCQNTLVDCFGGACDNCVHGECAALIDATEAEKEYRKKGHTIGELLKEMDKKDNEKLKDNFSLIGNIASELRKIKNDIGGQDNIEKDTYIKPTEELVAKISRNCMEVLRGESDLNETVVALAQYGIARDLIRARDGLLSIEGSGESEMFNKATKILFDAYSYFENRDVEGSKGIQNEYMEFRKAIKEQSVPFGLIKVAANGFYISRILGKPVPH
jgi:ArsR family metal-binding transcriptional regulator